MDELLWNHKRDNDDFTMSIVLVTLHVKKKLTSSTLIVSHHLTTGCRSQSRQPQAGEVHIKYSKPHKRIKSHLLLLHEVVFIYSRISVKILRRHFLTCEKQWCSNVESVSDRSSDLSARRDWRMKAS